MLSEDIFYCIEKDTQNIISFNLNNLFKHVNDHSIQKIKFEISKEETILFLFKIDSFIYIITNRTLYKYSLNENLEFMLNLINVKGKINCYDITKDQK